MTTADLVDDSAVTSSIQLPERPLVTIEPPRPWQALDMRAVWEHRGLLYFLTWRNLKIRYKQTGLGVAWAVLQPVLLMLIFALFFGRVAGIQTGGVPYPLFAYTGLLPWTFFANTVNESGNSLVNNSQLITKVYFPRVLVPTAAVAAGLVDLALSFVVLAPLMLWYGVSPGWGVALLPLMVLGTATLAQAVGMWASALNVRYRDVRFALPFALQLWMFVSPVIYPLSILPSRWRAFLSINPMTGLIEGTRSALLDLPFHWASLAVSAGVTMALLAVSIMYFRRVEKTIADIV